MTLTTILTIAVTIMSLLLSVFVVNVASLSHTWGYVNKYAVPLYEKEVQVTKVINKTIEFKYPEEGHSNDYIITAMHLFDMLQPELSDGNAVKLLAGGIGHNFTSVHFYMNSSYRHGIHFLLSIYGLNL